MFVYNLNPWNAETPVFCKVGRFFGPTSTWNVQNWLSNAYAHMPFMQDCLYRWLIQQLDIIIALVRIVLASG